MFQDLWGTDGGPMLSLRIYTIFNFEFRYQTASDSEFDSKANNVYSQMDPLNCLLNTHSDPSSLQSIFIDMGQNTPETVVSNTISSLSYLLSKYKPKSSLPIIFRIEMRAICKYASLIVALIHNASLLGDSVSFTLWCDWAPGLCFYIYVLL